MLSILLLGVSAQNKTDALLSLLPSVINFALNDAPINPSKFISSLSILRGNDNLEAALRNIINKDAHDVTFKDIFDPFPQKIEDLHIYEFMKNVSSKFNSTAQLSELFGSYYNDFVKLTKNNERKITDITSLLGIDKPGQDTETNKYNIHYFITQLDSPNNLTITDLLNGLGFDPFNFCNLFDIFSKYFINYNETKVYDFLENVVANGTQTLFQDFHIQMKNVSNTNSLDKETWNKTMNDILKPFAAKVEIFFSNAFSMLLSDFRTNNMKHFMDNAENNLKEVHVKLMDIVNKNPENSFAGLIKNHTCAWLGDLINGSAKLYGGKITKEKAEGIRYTLLNITSNENIWTIYKSLSGVFQSEEFDNSFLSKAVENLRILADRIEADEPFDNLVIPIFGILENCTDADANKSLGALYQSLVLGNKYELLNYVPTNLTKEDIDKLFVDLSQTFMNDEIEGYIDELQHQSQKQMAELVLEGAIPMNSIQMFRNLSFLSLCGVNFEKLDTQITDFNESMTSIINALNETNKYELDLDKIKEKKDFYIKPLADIVSRYHSISEKIKNNANIKQIYMSRFGHEMPVGKYTNKTTINETYDLLGFSDVAEFYAKNEYFKFEAFYQYWYNDTETNFSTEGYQNDFHIYSKKLSEISQLLYKDVLNITNNTRQISFEKAIEPFAKANTTLLKELHDIIINVDVESANVTQVAKILHVFGNLINAEGLDQNDSDISTKKWIIITVIVAGIFLIFGIITLIIRRKKENSENEEDAHNEALIQDVSIV